MIYFLPDSYAIDRYTIETKRILGILDQALEGKQYLCGDEYTIADMMHWRWTRALLDDEHLDGSTYTRILFAGLK